MDLLGSWCDPLDGESAVAFTAFRYFRDLYPSTRSIEDVVYELGVANDEITLTQCQEWVEVFRWDSRASEYDAWRDRKKITRQERIADARANISDVQGSIGFSFLATAAAAGLQMERSAEGVSATDAIKLARAGEELLIRPGSEVGRVKKLGERLETLSEDRLGTLLEILDEAGLELDELS